MTTKQKLVCFGTLAAVVILAMLSCREKPRRTSNRRTGGAAAVRQKNATVLLDSAAQTLNSLPDEVSLELTPPVVVLDGSRSTDGKEILATLSRNPQDPEGDFNYLSVPAGNANFRGAHVQAGDVVRYFVKYDTEGLEHGGGVEIDYIEIPVRRLDALSPNSALILDVPLTIPVEEPHRIEVWRFSDARMNEIWQRIVQIYVKRRDPAVAWEPTPDETALALLVDRLNQWYRNFKDEVTDWKPEPRLEEIRQQMAADSAEQFDKSSYQPRMAEADLKEGIFDLAEVRSLQEAIWHRDISTWAKGYATAQLDVAEKLFDWAVRNVQLDPARNPGIVHQPWQGLMYGHGPARMRTWIFTELCRHQFIDSAVLKFGSGDASRSLVAVLVDGEAYLFDPELGLPIAGTLDAKPATLRQVQKNPELLQELDLSVERPYPITAEDLRQVTVYAVATPLQLSRRARALEGALKGENYVVLHVDVQRLADKVRETTGLEQVELWPYPYTERIAEETMLRPQRELAAQQVLMLAQRPKLWKARVLHFMGPKPVPISQQNDPLARPREGHQEATSLYQDPELRLPEAILKEFDPGKQALYRLVKNSASYWLGLLSYDLGKYRIAEDWLRRRTLEHMPQGPWVPGARYNLARTLEKLDRMEDAQAILAEDLSAQQYGNRLRAELLGKPAGESGESTAAERPAAEPVTAPTTGAESAASEPADESSAAEPVSGENSTPEQPPAEQSDAAKSSSDAE